MKRRFLFIVFFLLCVYVSLNSFTGDNPYFIISKKDVELKMPKGFPKPVYNFKNNKPSPAGFTLGRKLFYDPVLSADSSVSCASCHQRFAAFSHIDHPLSHGINGLIGKRNVPAIQNLIWQKNFMWDGGVNHIELQPLAPMASETEMNEKLVNIIKKLQRNKNYVALFRQAFNDSLISTDKILKALTQFTGLMISADSRYDKYMAGRDTFSLSEKNGLASFRRHCANCHSEPLFSDQTFRNNGLKYDAVLKDSGRASITGLTEDRMKFKVPSLRNVELSYPYMHDGRFRNLQQVLEHYSDGVYIANNTDNSLLKRMNLNDKQRSDIIAFLKTLTDKSFTYDRRFAEDAGFNIFPVPEQRYK